MKDLKQNTNEQEMKEFLPKDTAFNPHVAQTAEGKVIAFAGEEAIEKDELKTFLFDAKEQYIFIESKEFQAVCPFSGLPDVANLSIEYHPQGGKALELKALKYYLMSFRNVGVYQERVTSIIYDDLKEVLETESLRISMNYNVRGGLYTTTTQGTL